MALERFVVAMIDHVCLQMPLGDKRKATIRERTLEGTLVCLIMIKMAGGYMRPNVGF